MGMLSASDHANAHSLLNKIAAITKSRDELDKSKAYSPISPLVIYQAVKRADEEISDLTRQYNDLMDTLNDQPLNGEETSIENIEPTIKTMTVREFLEYDPPENDPEKRKWKEIQKIYNNL